MRDVQHVRVARVDLTRVGEDTKVLGKLVARTLLAEKTRHIPGDIVEVGVFKGSGVLTWLKLKKLLFPNSMKKVIGFDFFDTKSLVDYYAANMFTVCSDWLNWNTGWWRGTDMVSFKVGRFGIEFADGAVFSENDWQAVPTAHEGLNIAIDS